MHRLSLFLCLIASVVPSLTAPTPSAPLHTYDGPVKDGSYIVKLRDGASQNTVLGLLGTLTGSNTVTHQWRPEFYNAFAGEFDQVAIDTFKSSPDVEYISVNGYMSAFDTQNDAPWNLARISTRKKLDDQDPTHLTFPYSYKGSTPGKDVDIYVVDTGIYTAHNDFGGRAKWGKTFCTGCPDADGHGHGTHVAGTAGGTKYGVAKAVNLIAVKVLNDTGYGLFTDIVEGIQWVGTQAKANGRSSIATMSLGGSTSLPLMNAVTALVSQGVPCTVAAGNSATDASNTSPANAPGAITVGATDITDTMAYYSNFGPIVDVFAPGSRVTSAWIGNPDAVNTISGTSMATPAVAGLVSYYISQNPIPIPPSPLLPPAMSLAIISKATNGKLSGIPAGTANRLAFNGYGEALW